MIFKKVNYLHRQKRDEAKNSVASCLSRIIKMKTTFNITLLSVLSKYFKMLQYDNNINRDFVIDLNHMLYTSLYERAL